MKEYFSGNEISKSFEMMNRADIIVRISTQVDDKKDYTVVANPSFKKK